MNRKRVCRRFGLFYRLLSGMEYIGFACSNCSQNRQNARNCCRFVLEKLRCPVGHSWSRIIISEWLLLPKHTILCLIGRAEAQKLKETKKEEGWRRASKDAFHSASRLPSQNHCFLATTGYKTSNKTQKLLSMDALQTDPWVPSI